MPRRMPRCTLTSQAAQAFPSLTSQKGLQEACRCRNPSHHPGRAPVKLVGSQASIVPETPSWFTAPIRHIEGGSGRKTNNHVFQVKLWAFLSTTMYDCLRSTRYFIAAARVTGWTVGLFVYVCLGVP